MLQVIDYFSILFVVLLGAVTSYEDIKERKIRNKWIWPAILIGMALQALKVVYIIAVGGVINPYYFRQYAINFMLTFLIGVVLWEIKIWNAADAKLFLAFSALIPISRYDWGYKEFFPAGVVLINTFAPLIVIFFFYVIFKTTWSQKRSVFKEVLNPKKLARFVFLIFGMSWAIRQVFNFVGINENIVVNVIFIFAANILFSKLFKGRMMQISMFLTVLALIFDFSQIVNVSFLLSFLRLLAIFILIRAFMIRLGLKIFTSEVSVDDLKIGDVIAEDIYCEKGKFKKKLYAPMGFAQAIFNNVTRDFLIRAPEELCEDDIELLRKLEFKNVRVSQTVPLAPFLFFGAFVTIIIQGNIIVFIKGLESFI